MQTTELTEEGQPEEIEETPPLSEETPVTIIVNDREVATLLCTPRDLRDLATGWLFAEGLIEGAHEIVSLAGCAFDREMLVRTSPDRAGTGDSQWRLVTSGCGAGANVEAMRRMTGQAVTSSLSISRNGLRRLFRSMLREARLYRTTGGVHSAALATTDGILAIREDLGRHNAVDKIVGYGVLNGVDFANTILLSTGRLSSEMAWKAARAGIPIAASLSVPSGMARDIAEARGVTLVGRAMASRLWVYSHIGRITE